MKIAIVGAGLIGCERIEAIKKIAIENNEVILSSVFDTNQQNLEKIKTKYNAPITSDFNILLRNNPDWIFICTPHNVVKNIIEEINNPTNLLIEKPLGRSLKECEEIIGLKKDNCKLHVGFNYRFFDGIEAALNDIKNNKFGKLISVNFMLGHGNAPGMEKSWKLDPIICGGGCLIDPGVHILDLILQIAHSKVTVDFSKEWRGFWNTGIEEEAHLILSDQENTIYNVQVSLNKWRSTFKMEINGTEGYGIVEGRGRSYGPQSYRVGKRWGWQSGKSQAESEEVIINNSDCNNSFVKETLAVLGLSKNVSLPCDHLEAKNVMSLLEYCRGN